MTAAMKSRIIATTSLVILLIAAAASPAWAHCDGMDGPVVKAGQVALETGDVRHALVWVLADGEDEVRRAFDHAVQVRGLGDDARTLADRFFFETLVRVHRAGEGEPYTGLKPAGRDLGAVIPAADRALEHGSVAELEALLLEHIRHGLHQRFRAADAARGFGPTDVAAGREYVKAYVDLLHYVEALHGVVAGHGHGAGAAGGAAEPHGH
ncbi:MAG TPA: DUF6448 family protein [Longimicrobiales bacterium]|nr:DUF6448 family protein [Longimicrobiales bacterium]